MQTDPSSIFATARDITVAGGMLFIITSSYFGKFQWTWQVEKQLAEREKVIAAKDAEIAELKMSVATLLREKDEENERYREVAWEAIVAAKQSTEVGQRLVGAVRSGRAR